MIKIQIPATSANLGAGFDALGLALTYYNYIEMEECDKIDITRLTFLRTSETLFTFLQKTFLRYAAKSWRD